MTHKEKVLALLSDGQPHRHMEGYRLGVMLHSRVADLRRDGHDIRVTRDGDDYLYELVGGPLVEAGVAHSDAQHVAPVSTSGPGVPSPELNQGRSEGVLLSETGSGQIVFSTPEFRKKQRAA